MAIPVSTPPVRAAGVLLALSALLHACGASPDGVPGDVPDLDGLPVWSLVPELRIGSLDDPDVGFSRVADIRVRSDGAIYVAEGQDRQIRVYEPDGRLRRRIGGPGAGPGEFGSVGSLRFVGDTLTVQDVRNRRIALFTAAGELLGTIPAPTHNVSDFIMIAPSMLRPDGLVLGAVIGYSFGTITGCPTWDSLPAARILFGPQGEVLDTLAWSWVSTGGWCREVTIGSAHVPTSASLVPQGRAEWPVGRDSLVIEPGPPPVPGEPGTLRLVRIVEASLPDTPGSERNGAGEVQPARRFVAGDTVYDRTFRYRPAPLTAAFADSVFGVRVQQTQPLVRDASPVDVQRALRAATDVPAFHAPVSRVVPTEDGGLWLRREDHGQPEFRWTMLDRTGSPMGQVSLPRTTDVHVVTRDHLFVVERDAFDVPYVVRYRLVPPAS